MSKYNKEEFVKYGHSRVKRKRLENGCNPQGRPRSPVKDIDPTCDTELVPIRTDASGHIFGRREIPENVRKMFAELVPECVAKLAELMYNGQSEKVQLDAANAIIAYGYGKPETVTRVQMEVDGAKEAQIAGIVRAQLLAHLAQNAVDVECQDEDEEEQE